MAKAAQKATLGAARNASFTRFFGLCRVLVQVVDGQVAIGFRILLWILALRDAYRCYDCSFKEPTFHKSLLHHWVSLRRFRSISSVNGAEQGQKRPGLTGRAVVGRSNSCVWSKDRCGP